MFENTFHLRYFEMGLHGEATPVTILTLLEETAADHCLSIGHSLYDLLAKGIGWVLLSGRMVMDRYPAYKEKITIKTWLSELTTCRGTRENLILDEADNIIGRAKGFWLFFDIKKRRPARIFEGMTKQWKINSEESIQMENKKIKAIDEAIYSKQFLVHRFDMDSNEHVNNLRYLQWAMECIPDEITDTCYLHTIDGNFVGEAQYGHTVESLTDPDVTENTFNHTLRDQSNKQVFSTAKTVWKNRINK
ncbi:MAG: thioesterase [Gracilimonas sp.]|uniref:acyl-[acyl-carrier-protein] thioesterase n=1 Tax=Gracilimonas sp. TaxID=1974203 RepID=UPI0037517E68|nr:thioesterase [Gracilimonas sp.]